MRLISGRPAAFARLRGNRENSGLSGIVRFYQYPGSILVEVSVIGLPNNGSGFHGLHIHTGGSCGGSQFSSAGGHFNPGKVTHPRHAGDLPPLLSYNGRGYMAVMTDRFSIRDIIGRTIVIHSMPDDLRTDPAGNSDSRIACGAILIS